MTAEFGAQNPLKPDSMQKLNNIYRISTLALLICQLTLLSCGRAPKDMTLVPEGEFIMGSNSGEPDEGPQKKVHVKAFYIDIYEVTNEQYREFVRQQKHREPNNWIIYGYREDKKDHPVTFVSMGDALKYCKWLGKRLPAEEEWEKAARATDGRTYPWGNEFDSNKANTSLSGVVGTTKTGTYKNGASPYGVYDMAGNVWEWTNSDYNEGRKVVRGGSWGLSHRFARTFTRVAYKPDTRINNLGFRCAKDR